MEIFNIFKKKEPKLKPIKETWAAYNREVIVELKVDSQVTPIQLYKIMVLITGVNNDETFDYLGYIKKHRLESHFVISRKR